MAILGQTFGVEANGDLVFYVSKTDAWDDLSRLLKLGKVRISITPNPLNEKQFLQELKLEQGEIFINYGNTEIKFWIDANHPIIQVDVRSKKPVDVIVTYENWRKERKSLLGYDGWSVWGIGTKQVSEDCEKSVYEEADSLVKNKDGKIISYHHNFKSIWNHNLQVQALLDVELKGTDPLLHRNFGLMIESPGMHNLSDTVLASNKPAKNFQLHIFPHTETGSVAEWKRSLFDHAKDIKAIPAGTRETAHKAWWKQFWSRSYIFITAMDSANRKLAETVTQGYILQRYINACGGRGNAPIKFNGSIFTVDTYGRNGDYKNLNADFRLWGGCYWWQNTRLPYWSLLNAGDFDLMNPLFSMYMKALPMRREATIKYYGHSGAFFPETMNFWGTYTTVITDVTGTTSPDGYVKESLYTLLLASGLELSLMMLDYYSFTKSKPVCKRYTGSICFGYSLRSMTSTGSVARMGKIHFDPAMSLETFHSAVNPFA
jgi:hypothetical protein